MTEEREFFSPERVDEQVDHFFQNEMHRQVFRQAQVEHPYQPEKRLVRDLQGYYQTEQQEDIISLGRAWKRVLPHLATSTEHPLVGDKPLSPGVLRISQEGNRRMYNQAPERSAERKKLRWPGILAAVLVAAVLVGGLLAVLNLKHSPGLTGSSQVTTPTSSPTLAPTAQPIGTTVYTTPAGKESYTAFAWSPDSKRVATIGGNEGASLHIWDATTGAHAVAFSLPDTSEWIMTMAWSPKNQDIALGTNKRLLIINGQTGAIVHSYVSSTATTNTHSSPYLSSQIPHSGGFGYRALAWSPDGKSLAAGISFGASGSIQVWNIKTATVSYVISQDTSHVTTSLAWSSDGRYLAAHAFNTQQGDATIASDKVTAWNTTTHRQVFSQSVMMDSSDAPIYWQPQSHNLAFSAAANIHQGIALQIWDVLKDQVVHKYAGKNSDMLSFSPDGKQLAYDGFSGSGKTAVGAISIMDVSTGAQVYNYKGSDGALAWSPNGKYIISASGGQRLTDKNGMPVLKNGQEQTTPSYAKVWIA